MPVAFGMKQNDSSRHFYMKVSKTCPNNPNTRRVLMKQSQTNRVTMFKTTAAVLDENHSIWSGMAPLVTGVQEFEDKLAAIDATAQKQETPTSGATVDKASARDGLEEVLFLTCEALGVIGVTGNDNDLVALTNFTPSTLHRLGDEELANRATTILEKANARKTELATFQVTQANIDELSQALQHYTATKEKPRTVTAGRAAETGSLESLIRDANGILRNRIDPMINLFKRSEGKFVSAYRSARVVVDRPATHKSPKPPTPPQPNP